ncbi:N-acetylmuramoyl-L-alanine amidase family protein [Paenibacillus oceani]|uniref:N-acetylmuramoyl-L-alanine amidase n=1 Tax=Paenibacillus oceani TaxID=2772510 RepID=A0A927C6T6_9BACL|nr:N-acetylmuramoyl-L-alanine amidase family protein [Paenibacillus oceani]MBD2861203.1 N-acetylmuramoyl-L-alanine amidase [Paenibacillus oceani]
MKYVKVLLPVLLVALLFMIPVQANAADNPIQLYLNSKKLEPEVPPKIIGAGVTVVPVRIVSQELGAKVDWNDQERKVKVEQGEKVIEMKIDDKVVKVNGKSEELEEAPMIVDGNTLVPIRFIAEQLGLMVGWDQVTQSVMLFKLAQESTETGKDGQAPEGSNDPNSGGDTSGKPGEGGKPQEPSGNGNGNGNGTSGSSGDGKPSTGTSGSGGSEKPTDTKKPEGGSSAEESVLAVLTKLEAVKDEIVIQTSAAVKPASFTLRDPFRIVIDLPNTGLGSFVKPAGPGQVVEVPIQHPKIDKVRYAQFSDNPSTVRIVFDMKQNSDYHLTENKTTKQWSISFTDKQFSVVIDAGHGGSDPGAGSINSRSEKDFTLAVANKVYKLLQKVPSIKTIMTRKDDTYPTLQERVDLANGKKVDLFVSIHGNSFKPSISGTETYYSRPDSLAFANIMHRHVIAAAGLPDRSVRKSDFKVIRETTMPAVLLEIGYLSNDSDEAQMYSQQFQDKVAEAIVAGIKEQLQIGSEAGAKKAVESNSANKPSGTGETDKSNPVKAAAPGTDKADTAKSDGAKAGTSKPGTTTSDTSKSDASKSDYTKSDTSKAQTQTADKSAQSDSKTAQSVK